MFSHPVNFQPQSCQLQQTNDAETTLTQGVQESVKFLRYSVSICELLEMMQGLRFSLLLKIQILWDVMLRRWVSSSQHFSGSADEGPMFL
jgi:hypothetical protein